jgi:hypothetical protein
MRPLHVVTAISNPIRWNSRIAHYRKFRDHMLDSGVELTVVECALGERPHELVDDSPHVTHVAVRADTLAWTKENLTNIGIQRGVPEDASYIAWIDADVAFSNPHWASDTVHALQQYAVVQPWTSAIDLGPSGEPMLIKGAHVQTSFAKVWREMGDIDAWRKNGAIPEYSYPHPGYAWAIRRSTLNNIGGLIEASGLGAGDHQMAMAFIGHIGKSIHGATTPAYQDFIRAWGERAYKYVQGAVGYVSGMLSHQWHGEKSKRKYQERWDVLVAHGFDPVVDLRKNLYGVLELAGNKPAMASDFDRYFRQRDEDANIRQE